MANRVFIGIELLGTAEAPQSSITIQDNYQSGHIDLGDASPALVTELLSPGNVVATVLDNGDQEALDLIYFASGSGAPLYIGNTEYAYDEIDWSRIEQGDGV